MSDVKCCHCQDALSESEMLQQLDEILDEYKGVAGALIPVLQTSQKMFGYLPEAALKKISLTLNKPYSEVAGVVGFYSFFSTVPRGKNLVWVRLPKTGFFHWTWAAVSEPAVWRRLS
jgi:NADH:ubiquinone oxidoreductase subunit E